MNALQLKGNQMECMALHEAFRVSGDAKTKAQAVNRLMYLGCKRQSDLLFDRFEEQEDELKLSILFAMRLIANERARIILANLFREPWLSVHVRAALTEVVGDIGLTECLPEVKQQLTSDSPEIRFWSCETLGMLGNHDDLATLKQLTDDQSVGWKGLTVSFAARSAMAMINQEESICPSDMELPQE